MYVLNNVSPVNQTTRYTRLNSVGSSIGGQKNRQIICKNNIEYQLSNFINWVFRVTASGEYSGEAAMELLDQAWMAQKLVWKLRE